jgi:DNA segregation ATPase FtsK/SpoIIIE-like protein
MKEKLRSAAPPHEHDDLYEEAVDLANEIGAISTLILQRKLRILYGRAARLLGELEDHGVIEKRSDSHHMRKVLGSS